MVVPVESVTCKALAMGVEVETRVFRVKRWEVEERVLAYREVNRETRRRDTLIWARVGLFIRTCKE